MKAWPVIGPIVNAILALAIFAVVSCILEPTAKRGSEVENELHGVLVAIDGNPVRGAKVKAVPTGKQAAKRASSFSAADSDSVYTDEKGRYAFRNLGSRRYNLFGDFESGTLVVLIPNVDRGDTSQELFVGTDTLRAPGRIRGRLMLGDRGKDGVLVYVPGTSYVAVSDDSGRFILGGVPQGRHSVRYSAVGFIIGPDTGVTVSSAATTDLPDKRLAHDPNLPPPAPQGLRAVYDTLNERVRLTWDPVPVSDLEGYVIYRDKPAFLDPQVVENGFVQGTSFVDSTFGALTTDERRSLVYRIKSRDREVNLSLSYSPPAPIEAVSRSWVTTRIRIETAAPGPGTMSVGDTMRMIVSYANPTRHNREIGWHENDKVQPLRVISDSSLSGRDTLLWTSGAAGSFQIAVRIVDGAGSAWTASQTITVLQDLPVASAGRDTGVSISDTVRLRGAGTDVFGQIAKWEWDVGGVGAFRSVQGGILAVEAPSMAGEWPCILRVTDDDGNMDEDTLIVNVLLDRPVARAGADTLVSIGDDVRLRGMGTDGFGKIMKWEWDIGAKGLFTEVPGGDISFVAPIIPMDSMIVCILRITDDDGQSSRDTAMVHVVQDFPVADAGRDFQASIGDRVSFSGMAADGFGRIVTFEWDLGGTGTFSPSKPDIAIDLPGTPVPAYSAILRVTDDDGRQDLDTVIVNVLVDRPVAEAVFPAGNYFTGDSVGVSAAGSRDRFGSILKVEWDPGATGAFRSSGQDTVIVLPHTPGIFRCILKVTDDDGQSGFDTLEMNLNERGGSVWFKASSSISAYPEIYGHVMLDFQGKMWLIGGTINPAAVLSTSDGKTWSTAGAPFNVLGLTGHTATVFRNEIWVIGGFSGSARSGEIWRSADGLAWTKAVAEAPFGRRSYHAAVVFNDRLWVIGGDLDGQSSDEIWHTLDGVAWEKAASPLPVGSRSGHSLVVNGGVLYMICGADGFTGAIPGAVWSSKDGLSWTNILSSAPFPQPFDSPALSHEGRIWQVVFRDVWSSADGISWSKKPDAFSQSRYYHGFVGYNGRIWVIGGDQVQPPDVWYSK